MQSETKDKTATYGTAAKTLLISGAAVTLQLVDKVYLLPVGEKLRSGVLYLPPHAIPRSWDALIVDQPNNVAYMLQLTVAKTHPVKRAGLVSAAEFLAKAGFAGDAQLVFLVCAHHVHVHVGSFRCRPSTSTRTLPAARKSRAVNGQLLR